MRLVVVMKSDMNAAFSGDHRYISVGNLQAPFITYICMCIMEVYYLFNYAFLCMAYMSILSRKHDRFAYFD